MSVIGCCFSFLAAGGKLSNEGPNNQLVCSTPSGSWLQDQLLEIHHDLLTQGNKHSQSTLYSLFNAVFCHLEISSLFQLHS